MDKQEIIDALTALAASLDAIKGSATDEEFRQAFRAGARPIDVGAKELGRVSKD